MAQPSLGIITGDGIIPHEIRERQPKIHCSLQTKTKIHYLQLIKLQIQTGIVKRLKPNKFKIKPIQQLV